MASQVKSFRVSRLTLGATSEFHQKVIALILTATAAELHIESLYTAYKAAADLLASVVNRATSYVSTATLKTNDIRRDRLIGVISNIVRANKTNPIEAKKEAATRLEARLSPYKNIGNHEYNKQTAEVKGLLNAIADEESVSDIATLGLTAEVEELTLANAAFDEQVSVKASEATDRLAQTEIDSAETVSNVNSLYSQIVEIVNVFARVQTSDAIEQFIADLNGLITVYASIAGGVTSSGSTSTDDTDDTDTGTDDGGDDSDSEPESV